ncbi:hypothetical protein [Flavobacterium sp. W22_SRS_FP1]|uniref:hypothetical protein n=1 Tax=Flavobacterium sp. W22_SRS_FP1 TaxID=3240276 RepID=UPI003F8F6EBD
MKKLLLCAVLLVGYVGLGQETIKATYEEITNAKERPSYAGDITEYIAKDGSIYKVGDKITIGVPSSNKTFAFLSSGDGIMMPLVPLSIGVSGQKAEIMKFRISGTRRAGFTIWLKAKSPYGIGNYNVDFENAVLNGELKSYGMTSDEALSELKKSKDKLDLGLISKEDYDTKKSELVKFIK